MTSSSTVYLKVVEVGLTTPPTAAHDPPGAIVSIPQLMLDSMVGSMPPSGSVSMKVNVCPTAGLRLSTVRAPASSTSPTVTVTATLTVRRLEPLWTSVATTMNSMLATTIATEN